MVETAKLDYYMRWLEPKARWSLEEACIIILSDDDFLYCQMMLLDHSPESIFEETPRENSMLAEIDIPHKHLPASSK